MTPIDMHHRYYPTDIAEKYRALGYWTSDTFRTFITQAARRFGSNTAVVGVDANNAPSTLTYAEIDEASSVLARGLRRRGITAGDAVVLQLPNITDFVIVLFALFKVGAIPVFALPAHRKAEISYFVSFTCAKAYIVCGRWPGADYLALAREVVADNPTTEVIVCGAHGAEFTKMDTLIDEGKRTPSSEYPDMGHIDCDAEELAFLQLSGGTTGVPKLIPRTHADYLYSVRESAIICQLSESTRFMVVLPVAHNFPMSSPGILGVLYSGGTVVLATDPSPSAAFTLIKKERVTITSLVPPMAMSWLASPALAHADLSSLDVLQVGGAKFAPEAARRVISELGCTLQQVFGMAEGLVNYTRFDDPEAIIVTTQGRPISADDEVRIVDDDDNDVPEMESGHLLARGPYTIRGYFRSPEHNSSAFTADGFYRTGDIARRLPSGHLIVEGRAKDQINRGGEKIAVEEVENILIAHEAVDDAVVVAIDDVYLGERTCAVILTGDPPSEADIKAFVRRYGVAGYKVPDRVVFVSEFPVTGVGKVSRRHLRAAVTESLSRRSGAPSL